jgi:hypothetical protein
MFLEEMVLGKMFNIKNGERGKITEIFCNGFNYHTLDDKGNCIKGQKYMLKTDFLTTHRLQDLM